MGCIINLGPVFFLFSLVLDLAYIEYSVYQIWSGYMQYSRYYNNSNKCLFLVFQQTEVLLNFFGECMCLIYITDFVFVYPKLFAFLCVDDTNFFLSGDKYTS